jgi:type IV pilus assembly protein PilW
MSRSNWHSRPHLGNTAGFTLVISGIIVAAIYSAYVTQQRVYLAQEQVAEMQQNLRAAADVLVREIRMAGYDPTGEAGAEITDLSPGQFSFSFDRDEDGDLSEATENIDLGFSAAAGKDANRDGIPDTLTAGIPNALPLGRQTRKPGNPPSGYQAIAENFQAIEFHYLDADGDVTTDPAAVRTVQFSLLARAGQTDPKFTNSAVYCPASNPLDPATGQCADMTLSVWGPYNDNFRRRLLITNVEIRNLGI